MFNVLKKLGNGLVEKLTSTTVLECEKGELKPLSDEQKAALVRATVPQGVTTIPHEYFRGCTALTEIRLPRKLRYISAGLFRNCTSLKSIHLPDGLTEIEAEAFRDCTSLESINIPDSVTIIGPNAFLGCDKLNLFPFKNGAFEGLPPGIRTLKRGLLPLPHGKKRLTIPEQFNVIGLNAFQDCDELEEIILPSRMTEIGTNAFEGCKSLKRISIPDGVVSIGSCAFQNCTSLEEVELPSSIQHIHQRAFFGCSKLRRVVARGEAIRIAGPDPSALYAGERKNFTETLTLSLNTFRGCVSLEEIMLPRKAISFGNFVFAGCTSLKHIALPPRHPTENLALLQKHFFCATLLQPTSPPPKLPKFSRSSKFLVGEEYRHAYEPLYGLISGCTSLESILIGPDYTWIPDDAFLNCASLKRVTLPDGLTRIGKRAFWRCPKLQPVIVPQSVTYIGARAFGPRNTPRIIAKPGTYAYKYAQKRGQLAND